MYGKALFSAWRRVEVEDRLDHGHGLLPGAEGAGASSVQPDDEHVSFPTTPGGRATW